MAKWVLREPEVRKGNQVVKVLKDCQEGMGLLEYKEM
jgi:hypothetical protein